MAIETAADVFSGETFKFHVPKPRSGCEMGLGASVMGFCNSRAEIPTLEDVSMASRNCFMACILIAHVCDDDMMRKGSENL